MCGNVMHIKFKKSYPLFPRSNYLLISTLLDSFKILLITNPLLFLG